MIRWITTSTISHTFIIADKMPGFARTYILEADKTSVGFATLEKYAGPESRYEIWMPLGVTQDQIDLALKKTEKEYLGTLYGWLQLVGFAIVLLLARMGWKVNNFLPLGAICSEVDWFYLKELKPNIFGDLDRNTTSPGDLRKIIKAHPDHFKLMVFKDYEVE